MKRTERQSQERITIERERLIDDNDDDDDDDDDDDNILTPRMCKRVAA